MKASVLIAAYNGGRYICDLIDSVLPQMREEDELIISDDNPDGDTLDAVEKYFSDKRVRYVVGPGRGIDKNKEHLLKICKGEVAFLCDQDDVWLDNKLKTVIMHIESGAECVMHDAFLTDERLNKTGETLFKLRNAKPGIFHNIIKNCYTGCCMALTRKAFEAALPFPDDIPMHDQWLGMVSEQIGRVDFIDEPLLLWRRHGDNATGGGSGTLQKIMWRAAISKDILMLRHRIKTSTEGNG